MPTPTVPFLEVQFADHCAWRGCYLYVRRRDASGLAYSTQVFRLTVDPHGGNKPRLTVAVTAVPTRRTFAVTILLPYIPWRWCMGTKYNPAVVAAYRWSSWFWHRVDGRYGGFRQGAADHADEIAASMARIKRTRACHACGAPYPCGCDWSES